MNKQHISGRRSIPKRELAWKILAPNGDFMCFVRPRKASWYLKKELAVQTSERTVKLTFEPGGPGARTTFDYQEREICCVVCGCEDKLTEHHVIPWSFRSWMGVYFSHCSHDIVLTCIKCHDQYECAAVDFRKILANRYGVPVQGQYTKNVEHADGMDVDHCIKWFSTYNRSLEVGHKYPSFVKAAEIVAELIRKYPTISVLVGHSMKRRSKKKFHQLAKDYFGYRTQGELIGAKIIRDGDVYNFAREWRKHFLDAMNPKFLTEGWHIDYVPIIDERKNNKK